MQAQPGKRFCSPLPALSPVGQPERFYPIPGRTPDLDDKKYLYLTKQNHSVKM
jgi:hypothetical protein